MKNTEAKFYQSLRAVVAILAFALMIFPSTFANHNSVSTAHQNKQDFTLHNETGLEIKEVYVSATGNDDWEEDILGTDTLVTGDEVAITFSRRHEDMWDMKVVFRNGKSNVWTKLNLSQITDVTVSFKNGKPWATWKNGDQ